MRRGSWALAWFVIGVGVGVLGVALGSLGQFLLNDVHTGHRMRQAQTELAGELTGSTSATDDPRMAPSETSSSRPSPSHGAQRPAIGDPVATLRWRNYEFVVVEGVGSDQLAFGPGRYPSTAMPGKPGNFAMAGHRVSYGAPFHDLDLLEPGDRIEVENRVGRLFIYRVVESTVVDPDETWVINRNPLGTNQRMLTMTTCHPKLSDLQRLVVWAALEDNRDAAVHDYMARATRDDSVSRINLEAWVLSVAFARPALYQHSPR